MKIKFVYSHVYFRNLNRFKEVSTSWDEMKALGKSFEKKYHSEIKKILGLIPQLTKKRWREREIKVYLVDWPGPSFSHPLTLKVRKDPLLMLVILAHELVHCAIGLGKRIGASEHKKINDITEQVFKRLKIDASKYITTMRRFVEKRTKKS